MLLYMRGCGMTTRPPSASCRTRGYGPLPSSSAPGNRRRRVQPPPGPLATVTTAFPPWLWIAIALAAVAHRSPGHPIKAPLKYSPGTVGTAPVELYPALKTHLREHHGDWALLAPHGLAT